MKTPDSPDAATRGPYSSPLRARQKEQTRILILEAVATILRRSEVGAVTIAEVARVAEVTERTVYRHFETREELLAAFWRFEMERTGGRDTEAPDSIDSFIASMRRLFVAMDRDEMLIRAVLAAPEGREIRRQISVTRLERLQLFLAPLLPLLSGPERLRVASAIAALSSIPSWLYMRDVSGYDGAEAAEAATLGIRLMIEAAQSRS